MKKRKPPKNGLSKTKRVRRIAFFMVILGVLCFIPVVIKMAKIQLVDYEFYQARAIEQQTRDTIVTPERGTIYDRNGNIVAMSATVETVFISPKEIKDDEMARTISSGLSEILEVDYDTVYKKTQQDNYYQVIKKRIETEVADKVREFVEETGVKGVYLVEDTKRYYPYSNAASQIIGFAGEEGSGLTGIESLYNSTLTGVSGRVVTVKNAAGTAMPFDYEEYEDAQDGQSIVLTIDMNVQQILDNELEQALADTGAANKVAGIIMNIKTSEILAMSTQGDFDLNAPFELDDATLAEINQVIQSKYASANTSAMDEETLEAFEDQLDTEKQTLKSEKLNELWRSKIISDTYEPGSTFKIITASMALELGVATEYSHFDCPGYRYIGKTRVSCHKKSGHGLQTFSKAIQNSCNCALMDMGLGVGNTNFLSYFNAFGLNEPTGIDLLGEANSIFHASSRFTEANKIELAVSSFGQTFKITPIQLITAISAVANDGKLMQPYIVKEYLDSDGNTIKKVEPTMVRQVVSEATSEIMCGVLEEVVSEGTGKNAYVKGYRIGGKTGTSEKIQEQNQEGQKDLRIASFVGIAPADDPQIAVLVIIDEPTTEVKSGSVLAAPVAGRIFSQVLPYLGIEPRYTADELVGLTMSTPSLVGATRSTVEQVLSAKGIKYTTVGDGDKCTDQSPGAGAQVPNNVEMVIYYGGNKDLKNVTMPDIRGLSPEAANNALNALGLYMRASGAVTSNSYAVQAHSQSIAPGTRVQTETVVSVEFYDPTQTDADATERITVD